METVITNEQHVRSLRARIVTIVEAMLSDDTCFLEGVQQLASLRHEVAVADNDPGILVFVGIATETDHLPIGATRSNWSSEAQSKHQPQIEPVSQWAREVCGKTCNSILERFNA